jgi:hypothetical protein
MSEIIPRKKAVPVQARRAETPVETIHIPGMPPVPPPPPPGVTQNIFYVNVPAGQPAPSPPPSAAPPEVHFHNTHVYEAPRRNRREIGTSFFGLWALVFATIAAVMAYVPPVVWLAKRIVEIGVVCAAVGFLGALLLRRVGRGVPLFALLMCGVAYCMYLNNSGQLTSSYDHLRSVLPVPLPKLDLDGKSATAAPQPPAQDPPQLHDHSIFGDGQGTWVKPTPAPAPAGANPPAPAPPVVLSTPPATASPPIDLASATANLERARTTAAQRMGIDYAGAKAAADQAMSEYQDARIGDAPGSAELIAASEKHLEADSRLNAIEMRLRSDPAVTAAEAALKSSTPTR